MLSSTTTTTLTLTLLRYLAYVTLWCNDVTDGTLYESNSDHALFNHVIERLTLNSETKCIFECIHDTRCRSVNFGRTGSEWACEKNDADKNSAPTDFAHRAGFVHYAIMNPVMENKDTKVDDVPVSNSTNSTVPDKPVYYGSCKEIYDSGKSRDNGVHTLSFNVNHMLIQVNVYCHMTNINTCGGGGWTMVMKTDGRKSTFKYSSSYWTDKNWYNPTGGESAFDYTETKLPTYWMTSFNDICLGMRDGGTIRFIKLNYQASSLYDVIAPGRARTTNLGRNAWKSLVSGGSLQSYCNWEGFNVGRQSYAQARIGIVANQETHCDSPDSKIGFGLAGSTCDTDSSNTCGNEASRFGDWLKPCFPDNGARHFKAFGYILVR